MTEHVLFTQLLQRDKAITATLDQQVAILRDTTASQIAAHDADLSERDQRHLETLNFLNALHEAEKASATLRRDSIVQAFTEEIDRLTRLSDQVATGVSIMPTATTLPSPLTPPGPVPTLTLEATDDSAQTSGS